MNKQICKQDKDIMKTIGLDTERFSIFEEVEAVLFDLDGVLVDTAVFHYQAWKRLANSMGFDFTEKQNEQLKGVSRMHSLELILKWGGVDKTPEEKQVLAAQKNQSYLTLASQMKPGDVLPGAVELLQCLKDAGYKMALGSASKNAPLILRATGIAAYFDAVIDGNMVENSKPHPEVFLLGAELLGIPPNKCLVMEDAQAGIDAARAAGMYVIGVGHTNDLRNADYLVRDLRELLASSKKVK